MELKFPAPTMSAPALTVAETKPKVESLVPNAISNGFQPYLVEFTAKPPHFNGARRFDDKGEAMRFALEVHTKNSSYVSVYYRRSDKAPPVLVHRYTPTR